MLDATVESVNSALKRARADLRRRRSPAVGSESPPSPGSPGEEAIVAKFVSAYEMADLDALVALLTATSRSRCHRCRSSTRAETSWPDSAPALRRRPEVRPRADTRQRSAGVRGVPARPRRHPPRGRAHRAHSRRRAHRRDDPVREHRPSVVRAAAIAPRSIAQPPRLAVSSSSSGGRVTSPRVSRSSSSRLCWTQPSSASTPGRRVMVSRRRRTSGARGRRWCLWRTRRCGLCPRTPRRGRAELTAQELPARPRVLVPHVVERVVGAPPEHVEASRRPRGRCRPGREDAAERLPPRPTPVVPHVVQRVVGAAGEDVDAAMTPRHRGGIRRQAAAEATPTPTSSRRTTGATAHCRCPGRTRRGVPTPTNTPPARS